MGQFNHHNIVRLEGVVTKRKNSVGIGQMIVFGKSSGEMCTEENIAGPISSYSSPKEQQWAVTYVTWASSAIRLRGAERLPQAAHTEMMIQRKAD